MAKIEQAFYYNQPGAGENNYIAGGPGGAGLEQVRAAINDLVDYANFFVGSTKNEPSVTVSSDGTTITAYVEAEGGGDIYYRALDDTKTFVATPSPASIALTPGPAPGVGYPVKNYLYIDHATGLLAVSTAGFPATPHCSLGEIDCRSAAYHQTYGFSGKEHKNHVFTPGDNGHMEHINEARRLQPCVYRNGCLLTATGSGTATVNFALSAGEVYRMHSHAVSAISSPANFFVNNHESLPDDLQNDLNAITTFSTGAVNTNKYCIYVFYIVHYKTTTSLFLLKPSGGYDVEADAYTDPDGYANWSIPQGYTGQSIYVARVIARRTASATTIFLLDTDVRSYSPGMVPGGSGFSVASDQMSTTDVASTGAFPINIDGPGLQIVNTTNVITLTLSTLGRAAGKWRKIALRFRPSGSELTLVYPTGCKVLNSEVLQTVVPAGTELSVVLSAEGANESDVIWSSIPVTTT